MKISVLEAEDASICDAGYNVKKSRKYFQKKKASGKSGRPKKKSQCEDHLPIKKEFTGIPDELSGILSEIDRKDKKV